MTKGGGQGGGGLGGEGWGSRGRLQLRPGVEPAASRANALLSFRHATSAHCLPSLLRTTGGMQTEKLNQCSQLIFRIAKNTKDEQISQFRRL